MHKLLLTFLIGCLFGNVGHSQSQEKLRSIVWEQEEISKTKELEIIDFLKENPSVKKEFTNEFGVYFRLTEIDPFGVPIYTMTDNSGAAKTSGTDALWDRGSLNLNLSGSGIEVGVWDGGLIRGEHNEFNGRVTQKDGAPTLSNHATHVTGTILAVGVNTLAIGMAPKATAVVFDFNNHTAEMASEASPDQNTLIISNHSYSSSAGWVFQDGGWQWFGPPNAEEDFKFGYYDGTASSWDNICYNAPYYTIVKSAGNFRNGIGDGSKPPNGPYDCISTYGNAKNIISVGAVNKITDGYQNPSDVIMSSFSSWGPTDDGRIKPDIVAAGVNLLSSSSSADNGYSSLSGTSMSAPTVSGSLILLQELHKNLFEGNFMKAASLKALIIQTAHKTKEHPGPDYRTGWGLLNTKGAAEHLLNLDSQNYFLRELTINNGEVYEMDIFPKQGQKITATIAWTDLPGNPPPFGTLNSPDLMLINDLDLRLVDDAGNEIKPWILDGADPEANATKGDNFRDNVEKIEFFDPEPRKYTLRVSHKGILQNGSQDFSLILSYQSDINLTEALYWVGGNGNWNDPDNWSFNSGGTSASLVPDQTKTVIIDENSFSGSENKISLSSDISIKGLTWLTKEINALELNGDLIIEENFVVSSENLSVDGLGYIVFMDGGESSLIDLNGVILPNLKMRFSGDKTFFVNNLSEVDEINLRTGRIQFNNDSLVINNVNDFESTGNRSMNLADLNISGLSVFNISNSETNFISNLESSVTFDQPGGSLLNLSSPLGSRIIIAPNVDIDFSGNISLENLRNYGQINLVGDAELNSLFLGPSSQMFFGAGSTLIVIDSLNIESDEANRVKLYCEGGNNGILNILVYDKFCFDYLDVENINFVGTGILNAGTNSNLINSENWLEEDCNSILFANFQVSSLCQHGFSEFVNKSSGPIQSTYWTIGLEENFETLTEELEHVFSFPEAGNFIVQLVVEDENFNTASYESELEVISNTLGENTIIADGPNLISENTANTYRWFKNGDEILGEKQRFYRYFEEPGIYFVVTSDDICSRKSKEINLGITSLGPSRAENNITVYPNPLSTGKLNIMFEEPLVHEIEIDFVNLTGGSIFKDTIPKDNLMKHYQFDVNYIPKGIYFLILKMENKITTYKILK